MLPWKKWGRGCVELVFPVHCVVCRIALGQEVGHFCPECLSKVPFVQSPLCSCCGRELPGSAVGDHLCGSCLRKPPVFAQARAVVRYEEPVSHLLHRLKYGADTATLPLLAQIAAPFAARISDEFQPDRDRVVPVPLFPKRLKKRGLNQSLLLSRIFFPTVGDALLVDALIRIRDTVPQTTLDGAARRRNLRSAFVVQYPDQIRGRRIFLVDDVFTTGTTVTECGKALLAAGAVQIRVVTVARVGNFR